MDLKFYLSLFLRRLPYVLLLTMLGAVVGGMLALLLPPVYQANSTLVVEPEQIPDELAASTVRTEAVEQLQIIQQRILTRDTLLEMANRLDVYAPLPGQAPVQLPADAVVADMRRRIAIVTTGGAQQNRGPVQATIVTVGFEAPTAQLAAAVANEVVTLILRENVEMRTRTAGQTLDFFIDEVERLDEELASRGAAVQAFQEANRDALPESLDFRRSQLVSEQERLLQIQRDEASLRDRRASLVEIYESTGSLDLNTPEAQLTPEQRELQALRNQLSTALAVLSPTNPRITILQNQIAGLEARVAAGGAGGSAAGAAPSVTTAYEMQLADLDAQLEYLAEQRAQVEEGIGGLTATIGATPGNAIRLDELQRNFDNVRAQYDQAVERRALAETGEQIETLSRGQRISVIEPAIPPANPTSPNRPVVAAGGMAGGLALGLALVALLEVTNRSIRRPTELTDRLGMTPFAAVPLLRSRYDVRRSRLRLAGALLVVLVGIPGALWLVHSRVMPLDLLADQVLQRLAAGLAAAQSTFG